MSKKAFGTTSKGVEASLYEISNGGGLRVLLTDYGAAVVSIFVLKMNYLFSRIECCYKIHIKLRCPEFNSPYINRKRKPPLLRVMVFFF